MPQSLAEHQEASDLIPKRAQMVNVPNSADRPHELIHESIDDAEVSGADWDEV